MGHVETSIFFADVLDDQFPLTGSDVFDRNARIVRHYNQVDGLDGFGVGFHPTDLLSSVHRPTIAPDHKHPHRGKTNKNKKGNRIIDKGKGHPCLVLLDTTCPVFHIHTRLTRSKNPIIRYERTDCLLHLE